MRLPYISKIPPVRPPNLPYISEIWAKCRRGTLHNKTMHAKTNEAQLLIADWFCSKSIFSLSFSTEEKATVYLVNPSFS